MQLDGKCKHPELWYHPLPWRAVRAPATRLPEAQATTGCENQTSGTGEARERAGKGVDQLSSPATTSTSKKTFKLRGKEDGWDGAVGSEISTGDVGPAWLFWGFLTIESLKSLFEDVLVRDACGWGHWESESPPEALGVHSVSGSLILLFSLAVYTLSFPTFFVQVYQINI